MKNRISISSGGAAALAIAAAAFLLFAGPTQPARSQSLAGDGAAAGPAAAAATATPILPPQAPFLLGPPDSGSVTGANSGPLGLPTFTWSTPPNAVLFHIQVSKTPGFSDLIIDADTEAASFTPTAINGKDSGWIDGPYYWRVKAAAGPANKRVWSDYSPIWTFTKDWSAGGEIRPILLQPPVDSVRSSFAPGDFTWLPMAGAAGYLFEIAADDLFATVPYKAETLKAQHTPGLRLVGGDWFWRVTPFVYATSPTGRVYGAPSATGRFRIDWSAPPVQLAPADDIATPFVPRFQWQAVEGAKRYQLQVGTDSDFNPTTTYNTANTDFTPITNLANDKEYFWRVKAIDQNDNETAWSAVRSFRTQWNFAPQLLTPRNNQINLSYPYFSWEPVPGAEQYQIQIDNTNQFVSGLIADENVYNVTNYTQPDWGDGDDVPLNKDGFWRVRAIDASGNFTPWSETWAFSTAYSTLPSPVYPLYTFAPDSTNLPVHRVPTIAWPVFVWDTAHEWVTNIEGDLLWTVGPDYYAVTVDDEPGFAPPHNFYIDQTRAQGATPVLDPGRPERAFSGLVDGKLYYWRVEAFRNGQKLGGAGVSHVWEMRYDHTVSELTASEVISPAFPRDGYQAVAAPPMLGWLPVVTGGSAAYNYHVQISRTPDFTLIVDEAYPQFVNYMPWQGHNPPGQPPQDMPPGSYWWRVRAESSLNVELTPWSEPRRFDLSLDLLMGNPNDWPPPDWPSSIFSSTERFDPSFSLVATSTQEIQDQFRLNELHVMLNRSMTANLNWVFAFDVDPTPSEPISYTIFVDNNHIVANKPCAALAAGEADAGAPGNPTGRNLAINGLYAPEYAIDIGWNGSITGVKYYRWNGVQWNPACEWAPPLDMGSIGGNFWYDDIRHVIQILVPYTALAGADDAFSGSLAFALISTSTAPGDGIHSSIPPQGVLPGSTRDTIDNPVFVSDMLQPLYPFDMPLSNPQVYYDMPPLRWRMPVFDSVDGYQVEVASDERFSHNVETWESYETKTWPFFALIPATFQSIIANADNESYYWRVRIRHERTTGKMDSYDYGPWSPPQRFKLDSRMVGNPRLSTGSDVFMTPTFEWDRVEGAASYRLQVDDDVLFGSPLIDVGIDGTSYTPQETSTRDALSSHVQYYWRVAMRRSDKVLGAWTPTMLLDKNSVTPAPLYPLTSDPLTTTVEQPTFVWTAVLTPSDAPRLAAPLYQLQVDNSEDFKSPEIDIATAATSYTPIKGKSLADGRWYWRVAIYEATGKPGPFSPTQVFNKQYPLITPIEPISGAPTGKTPRFAWQPAPGAAYYVLEVAQERSFQKPDEYKTANTTFTPPAAGKHGVNYWRVWMVDHDGKEGPIVAYEFNLGRNCYLPLITKW